MPLELVLHYGNQGGKQEPFIPLLCGFEANWAPAALLKSFPCHCWVAARKTSRQGCHGPWLVPLQCPEHMQNLAGTVPPLLQLA